MVHVRLKRLGVQNRDRLTDPEPDQPRKNLPRGRLGDVKFEVTTEGCEKPCLISKA